MADYVNEYFLQRPFILCLSSLCVFVASSLGSQKAQRREDKRDALRNSNQSPQLKKLDDDYHQVRYALPIFRKGFLFS